MIITPLVRPQHAVGHLERRDRHLPWAEVCPLKVIGENDVALCGQRLASPSHRITLFKTDIAVIAADLLSVIGGKHRCQAVRTCGQWCGEHGSCLITDSGRRDIAIVDPQRC